MRKALAWAVCLLLLCVTMAGAEESGTAVASDEFVLESGGYALRAVHTYPNDGQAHPTVLMIAGSGPSDADETIGVHTPFKDLDEALAARGIASLRVDKRTLRYAAELGMGGIEEEYLIDCRAALAYLSSHPATGKISLLGHSLGGQMALILQSGRSDIAGVILLNSTLRHLAELAYDQYAQADPANAALYRQFSDMAIAAKEDTAIGYYFYGAPDAYWATYNAFDFVSLAQGLSCPALIINSTADTQLFPADLTGLQAAFQQNENAACYVDDRINHFGYVLDFSLPESLYTEAPYPEEIVQLIAGFLQENE